MKHGNQELQRVGSKIMEFVAKAKEYEKQLNKREPSVKEIFDYLAQRLEIYVEVIDGKKTIVLSLR